MKKTKQPEGWAVPEDARKAHYFEGRRSLCGRWAWFGDFSMSMDESPSHCCIACKVKFADKILEEMVEA